MEKNFKFYFLVCAIIKKLLPNTKFTRTDIYGFVDFMKNYIPLVDKNLLYSILYDEVLALFKNKEELQNLIACFSASYLMDIYKRDTLKAEFIKNSGIEKIVDNFVNNKKFGMDIIDSYIRDIIGNEKNYNDFEELLNSSYGITYLKLVNQSNPKIVDKNVISVKSLPVILREVWIHLFNYYKNLGYSDDKACSAVWDFYLKNKDPLNELAKICGDEKAQKIYKIYMLRILYADIFEDSINNPCFTAGNDLTRNIYILLSFVISSQVYSIIPNIAEVRNALLKYFLVLQANQVKMRENRKHTLERIETVQILQKINPAYKIDSLNYMKNK